MQRDEFELVGATRPLVHPLVYIKACADRDAALAAVDRDFEDRMVFTSNHNIMVTKVNNLTATVANRNTTIGVVVRILDNTATAAHAEKQRLELALAEATDKCDKLLFAGRARMGDLDQALCESVGANEENERLVLALRLATEENEENEDMINKLSQAEARIVELHDQLHGLRVVKKVTEDKLGHSIDDVNRLKVIISAEREAAKVTIARLEHSKEVATRHLTNAQCQLATAQHNGALAEALVSGYKKEVSELIQARLGMKNTLAAEAREMAKLRLRNETLEAMAANDRMI